MGYFGIFPEEKSSGRLRERIVTVVGNLSFDTTVTGISPEISLLRGCELCFL